MVWEREPVCEKPVTCSLCVCVCGLTGVSRLSIRCKFSAVGQVFYTACGGEDRAALSSSSSRFDQLLHPVCNPVRFPVRTKETGGIVKEGWVRGLGVYGRALIWKKTWWMCHNCCILFMKLCCICFTAWKSEWQHETLLIFLNLIVSVLTSNTMFTVVFDLSVRAFIKITTHIPHWLYCLQLF